MLLPARIFLHICSYFKTLIKNPIYLFVELNRKLRHISFCSIASYYASLSLYAIFRWIMAVRDTSARAHAHTHTQTQTHIPMALVCQGLLIAEFPRSHSDTPHSVGLLWTSVQLVAETSIWQHKTFRRNSSYGPGKIWTCNMRNRAAADGHLRPRGDRDGRLLYVAIWYYCSYNDNHGAAKRAGAETSIVRCYWYMHPAYTASPVLIV